VTLAVPSTTSRSQPVIVPRRLVPRPTVSCVASDGVADARAAVELVFDTHDTPAGADGRAGAALLGRAELALFGAALVTVAS
jgi:hypothetical protein